MDLLSEVNPLQKEKKKERVEFYYALLLLFFVPSNSTGEAEACCNLVAIFFSSLTEV